jgi:hypothetical protein
VGQLPVAGAAVLHRLGHGRPNLAQQRRVDGKRLVHALQNHDAPQTAQQPRDEIAREGPEHGEVDDADPNAAGFAEVVADRLGVGHQRPLADDGVLGVLHPVAGDAGVLASRELGKVGKGLIAELRDVVEVEGALRRNALRVAVLVLHGTEHRRIVEVEELGDAAAALAEHQALRRRRRVDHVARVAEELRHQIPLRQEQRFDHVTGQEAVLRADARVERELGDAVGDQVEIRHLLDVLGEELEESRVVDGVVVVVTAVDVEGVLGDRAAGDVEDVGEALADGRVKRFVHVGDALTRREVGRAQADEAHAGSHGSGCVLAFGLEEDQPAAVDVGLALRHRLRPALAHLGGGRDRVGTRRFGRGRLHRDDRRAAVHRLRRAREPRGARRLRSHQLRLAVLRLAGRLRIFLGLSCLASFEGVCHGHFLIGWISWGDHADRHHRESRHPKHGPAQNAGPKTWERRKVYRRNGHHIFQVCGRKSNKHCEFKKVGV